MQGSEIMEVRQVWLQSLHDFTKFSLTHTAYITQHINSWATELKCNMVLTIIPFVMDPNNTNVKSSVQQ